MRRRKFVAWSLAGLTGLTGGAGWWLAVSKRRSARWARRLLEDARRPVLAALHKPTPQTWSPDNITLAWLGHSTILIDFYGIRILTDPTLGSHIGFPMGLFTAGPKRYVAPALSWKDLPAIDVLLLSHAHMDHLDLPSLRHFPPSTFAVSAKSTADLLAAARLKNVTELAWGERAKFSNAKGSMELEAVEVKHWGARWPSNVPRGYNGYILRREGKVLLFAGDTAFTPMFANYHSRGPFDVAVMPIGAYRPWIAYHCDPEQAVAMANQAGARYIVPVHHQTFKLSEEPLTEPIERLQQALAAEPERLAIKGIGETFVLPKGA